MIKLITGKDLFYKFFELKSLEPKYNNWTISKLKSNKPRYYRLLQILAILKYLNIHSVQDLVTGKFINMNNKKYYDGIIYEADKYLKSKSKRSTSLNINKPDLVYAFINMLDYREILSHLEHHQSGIIEASGMYLWTYYRINDANIYLRGVTKYIDSILMEFIFMKKEFSIPVNKLVKDYKYPDVDLDSIDADNF